MNDCSDSFVSIGEALGLNSSDIMTKLNQNKQKHNIVTNTFERLTPKQKSANLKKIAQDMCNYYYSNDGNIEPDKLSEWIEVMSRMIGFENHMVKMNYHQKRIRNRKVIFLGSTNNRLSKHDIQNICKKYGFCDNQIEIRDDYDKMTNLKLDNLKNNKKYLGIIIGALPHSIKGMSSTNFIKYLEDNSSEYPPYKICRDANNQLGFSANTVKSALSEIIRLATNL